MAAKNDLKLRTIWYHTAERKAKVEREQAEARRERAKQQEEGNLHSSSSSSAAYSTSPSSKQEKKMEALSPGLGPLASMATASADRFFKDKGAVHVSTMDADDYLTHFIVKEFADAEVETLLEIGPLIEGWLLEGGQGQTIKSNRVEEQPGAAAAAPPAVAVPAMGMSMEYEEKGAGEEGSKFCIACRAVLPTRAKFCSACGESQG